jgi:hypothetical protein
VRAFNGLDVLVARDEGLFAAEGLDVQCASHQPGALRSTAEGTLTHPVTNQGRLLERGAARRFQVEPAAITAGWRKAQSVRGRSDAGPWWYAAP